MDAEASDSSLARSAAAGNDRAFAALVRRHKDEIYRLLRRYTGDPDEAYEAAHEAFIAAWKALKRYDPERPFGTWLRTIAINKARDRGRRMRVRRVIFGSGGLDEAKAQSAPDPADGADTVVLEAEQARRLDGAIAGLPAALKEALIMTALEGLSQLDVARHLGVSVKTIETRAYRARKLLAVQLDADLRPSTR